MKRNWGLAAVILAFIIAYQYMVLAPAQRKQIEELKAKEQAAQLAKGETAKSAASVAKENGVTTEPPKAAAMPVAQDIAAATPGKSITLSLGAKRTLEVTGNGSLKSAVLEDFSPLNGPKTEPVVIMPEGVSIASNNTKVNTCLQNLRPVEEGGKPKFLGKLGVATCEVTYTPDPQFRGLLNAVVNLQGFESEQGEIFLKFAGSLGSDNVQDQNFLSYRVDDSKHNLRSKELFKATRVSGKVDWLAWGDRYFSTIFIPKGRYNPTLFVEGQNVDAKDPGAVSNFGASYALNPEKLTTGFSYEYSIYFGTRDPRELEEISPVLIDTVDLGFFASIARLMLWALHFLYKIFGNYGWAIVALTVFVRVLFWPLNRKAYQSSLAMKNIQPEMNKIKEKYGKDPARATQMNAEVMALYKKNKVNPLGGCLPIFLQIPIFIGLYGALNHSIDLYGAPFFGWIQNLSAKDPFYVLPALWTVSLLAYTQLNPQQAQSQPGMPDMKWMFVGMNVFFGYLSAKWPSGLTLYLFVSNLVGIAQQLLIRRGSKKLEMVQEGA